MRMMITEKYFPATDGNGELDDRNQPENMTSVGIDVALLAAETIGTHGSFFFFVYSVLVCDLWRS